MAQDDPKALNCRVRIDLRVHPSLYQELESLGRKDRCERLRSLAQQGLLAEALGVDVVAAAAKGNGSTLSTRSKRKPAQRKAPKAQAESLSESSNDVSQRQGPTSKDEAEEVSGSPPADHQPSKPPVSDSSGEDGREEPDRADPLRSSSKRLMGRAGMLMPGDDNSD